MQETGKGNSAQVTPLASPSEDLRSLPPLGGRSPVTTTKFDVRKLSVEHFYLDERKEEEEEAATSTQESPASPTSPIEVANQMLTQMKCAICLDPSTGFCVGCPRERYCYNCYHQVHSVLPGSHRFVSYVGVKNVRVRLMLKARKAE